MKNYQITIGGYKTIHEFVYVWLPRYKYPNYEKYSLHIDKACDDSESLRAMFEWKNGTEKRISESKSKVVASFIGKIQILKDLKQADTLDWEIFESTFEPHKNSTIWKTFLIHLIQPSLYPIFDQHVYRSYCFFTEGKIKELPKTSKQVYKIYKEQYLPWVLSISQINSINLSELDRALFSFGKVLKVLTGLSIYGDEFNKSDTV
jgi:hypothetical protein